MTKSRELSGAETEMLLRQRYCLCCKGKIGYLTTGGNTVSPRNYVKKNYCQLPKCVSAQKRANMHKGMTRKEHVEPYEFKGIDYFTLGRGSGMSNNGHIISNTTINDFEHERKQVIEWMNAKQLFDRSSPLMQMEKMIEEVYELEHEVRGHNRSTVEDELGDVLFTAVVQAGMWNLDPTECLAKAVKKVISRKGKMINGIYVKESDL